MPFSIFSLSVLFLGKILTHLVFAFLHGKLHERGHLLRRKIEIQRVDAVTIKRDDVLVIRNIFDLTLIHAELQ
jgi:hypothetical protein